MHSYLSWDDSGRCWSHGQDEATAQALSAAISARPALPQHYAGLSAPLEAAWDAAGHRQRVDAITAAIARGEVYQANLTLPWRGQLAAGQQRDVAIYQRLRQLAPGCFGAFLRRGPVSILSHSPECFLRCDGRTVISDPIKGTRARQDGADDQARADLLAAGKDNAELAMIVDLVRNDLGRVAQRGGVHVATPAHVIDLPYVHHLVASVHAPLPATCRHADLL
ncbi:MAG: chorismate-binding protein, partial [Planctomycetota bacterium]